MRKISGNCVEKQLRKNGFVYYQMKGSHKVMTRNGINVHIPMYKILTEHIIKRIEKKTGVKLRSNTKGKLMGNQE